MWITKDVAELKPHPMNEYLFDDIEGDKWEEFLDSVKRRGIMHPLMITEDGTIISGHQRWRACLALNIPTVQCYIYKPKGDTPDDDILLALIESNIRQRGVVNSPTVKLGRMLTEYERILGAGDRDEGGLAGNGKITRKAIRKKLKINENVAKCSKAIAAMPDEIQELVEQECITPYAVYKVCSKLTPEEQIELAKKLDPERKYTRAELQEEVQKESKAAVERFFPKAKEIEAMQEKLAEYQQNDGELELREKLREAQEKERQAYEKYQAERRARKKDCAEYEKSMDAMEKLLDEQGGGADEIARLTEERDQYMKDADNAQADADIELVSSLIGAMSGAFAEVANDPRPLCGQRAGTAMLMINNLEEKLEMIRERLTAGDSTLDHAS